MMLKNYSCNGLKTLSWFRTCGDNYVLGSDSLVSQVQGIGIGKLGTLSDQLIHEWRHLMDDAASELIPEHPHPFPSPALTGWGLPGFCHFYSNMTRQCRNKCFQICHLR